MIKVSRINFIMYYKFNFPIVRVPISAIIYFGKYKRAKNFYIIIYT